jgi:hypothetical protein
VGVHDGLGDPALAGDVGDRRRLVALLGHAPGKGPEDPAAAMPVVHGRVVDRLDQVVHQRRL